MKQAIAYGVGDRWISHDVVPPFDGQLAGNDGRTHLMSVSPQFKSDLLSRLHRILHNFAQQVIFGNEFFDANEFHADLFVLLSA